ncbi:MAG TPA: M15 family metallopeptidase [Actinomycetota bacterium]
MHPSDGLRWASLAVALTIAGASGPPPERAAAVTTLAASSRTRPSAAGPRAGEDRLASQASGFRFEIERVRRADLGRSWGPGCPVPPRQLRLLTVRHWGFDGEERLGRLVLRRRHARPMVRVMRRLFRVGYPIKRMRPVDRYGGSDRRSMRANNTSAFNCRTATSSTSWSEHAYGRAIDLNPVQNPYVTASGRVLPRRGRRFVDRSVDHPAVIRAGDPVVRTFARIGWSWGGDWSSTRDYQHFSSTGR